MNPAKASKMCRCGHPRRFHDLGTIFQGFDDRCLMTHHNGPEAHPDYRGGACASFEPVEWQEAFAAALRAEGYVVQRVQRVAGRFTRSAS